MTGSTLTIFTVFHVALSLVGIASGAVAILGVLRLQPFRFWNGLFLWATAVTALTGFFFPYHGITPGIVIGVVCLLALAIAAFALRGGKRGTYTGAVCFAEALNVIVLVTQLFEKVPALHSYAPTGREPIVAIIQLMTLFLFIVLAWVGIMRIRRY
jgi:hypothetical protein